MLFSPDARQTKLLNEGLTALIHYKDKRGALSLVELAEIEALQAILTEPHKKEYSGRRCECGGKLVYDEDLGELLECCEDCGKRKIEALDPEID